MLRVVLPLTLVLWMLGPGTAMSLAQSARTATPAPLRAFEYTARPTTIPTTIPGGTIPTSVSPAPRGALTLASPGVPDTSIPGTPRQSPPMTAASPSPNTALGNTNAQPVRDSRLGGQPTGNNVLSAQRESKDVSTSERLESDRAKAESSPTKKTPSSLTDPMLQNMSNPQNLSHTGITSDQQMAPNLYLGRRFDNWSGQMSAMPQPMNTGEPPRFQPGPFGGYIAPNTYLGGGNSSWSNLSTGRVSPSPFGAWGYSSPW